MTALAVVGGTAIIAAPTSSAAFNPDGFDFWVDSSMGPIKSRVFRAADGNTDRVVYALDGMRAREDLSGWEIETEAARELTQWNINVVMPVGGQSSFYTDWNAASAFLQPQQVSGPASGSSGSASGSAGSSSGSAGSSSSGSAGGSASGSGNGSSSGSGTGSSSGSGSGSASGSANGLSSGSGSGSSSGSGALQSFSPGPGKSYPYRWESFLTQDLRTALRDRLGFNPNRNGVFGLSMGGSAALTLAAYHPEQFSFAGSFSGYLNISAPGMREAIRIAMLDAGGYNVDSMAAPWDAKWLRMDPFVFAPDLIGHNTRLWVSAASGRPSASDGPTFNTLNGMALEALALVNTRAFQVRMTALGASNVTYDFPAFGIHAWNTWQEQISRMIPDMSASIG